MAANSKGKRYDRMMWCANWPYGSPDLKRAPFDTKCADSGRRIERGEMCAVHRGYWYKLDSPKGRRLHREASELHLDAFA